MLLFYFSVQILRPDPRRSKCTSWLW